MLDRRGTSKTSSKVRRGVVGRSWASRRLSDRVPGVNDWRQMLPERSGTSEVLPLTAEPDARRVAEDQVQGAPGLEGAALAAPWGALEGEPAVGGDPGPGGAGVAQREGHLLGRGRGGGGAGLAAAPVVVAGVVTNAGWASLGSGAGRSSPQRDTSRITDTQTMATTSQLGPRRPVLRPPMARGDALEQGRVGPLLGPVGLQQRGRVDAQVAGVGAQEALGVDAPPSSPNCSRSSASR